MKNNNNNFANNPYINGGFGGGFNGGSNWAGNGFGAGLNGGGNPYAGFGSSANYGAGFNGFGGGFNGGFGAGSSFGGGSNAGSNTNFAGLNTGDLLKGALLGAAAAYILSNEDLQKKLFKTLVSLSEIVGSTIEEMKERYEDMKAEVQVQRQ
ncbi:MAG: hypothetical protein ACTTIC_08035 [Helicobacteraceae bacterium]